MSNGRIEKNPPVTIYDLPFTDPNIEIDIQRIACIREQWILDRNDVEELTKYHLITEKNA
jgi:phosphomethylpyrimidine synthase